MDTSDTSSVSHTQVAPATVLLTHDEERIEHIVSDDMLMRLAEGGRDISLQISLAALGVAVGLSQNLFSAISAIREASPIGQGTAVGAGICIAAGTLFVSAMLVHRRNGANVNALLDKIRNRKTGVMVERGNPYAGGAPFSGDPSMPAETSATTD
jgi:hypothetical protein